jgi:hypothetical protein
MMRFVTLVLLVCLPAAAQIQDWPSETVRGIDANYTEARVGEYQLPDPLTLQDGRKVRDAKTWMNERRPEIVRLFEENQFGRTPKGKTDAVRFEVFDKGTPAFDGKAVRRQVTILFSGKDSGPKADLLLYLPANVSKPVPVFLQFSFAANSLAVDDPGVREGFVWNREHQRVPARQGRAFGKLDVPAFVEKGFGVATIYYGDLEPDFDGGIDHGLRTLFPSPKDDEWGAIGAWSWGLSRVLDYFETDSGVDAKRVALFGVSRLGKTVLWAGAIEPRFAMVISSCSGEGGAALSRRNYGETIKHINASFSYWFDKNYKGFEDDVARLPVDSHLLLSLIAPRPLLLQTGSTDKWSDPMGEFLAAKAASPVYELLGKKGLRAETIPPMGEPILNDLGYLLHDGGHGTVPADWPVFIRFMQLHLAD